MITGAGRGIGRGIALSCAQEGMNVVLAGYTPEPLNETAKEIKALGAKTLVVQTDVSLPDQVKNLANQSFAEFEDVHLLVNNAGVANPGKLLDISMDNWQWVMGVNFYGLLYGMRAFAPRMVAQESESRIVNVSSISGLIPANGSYSETCRCRPVRGLLPGICCRRTPCTHHDLLPRLGEHRTGHGGTLSP